MPLSHRQSAAAQDRTTILIAHDRAITALADRTLVLADGLLTPANDAAAEPRGRGFLV